jgi:hypothetical protein
MIRSSLVHALVATIASSLIFVSLVDAQESQSTAIFRYRMSVQVSGLFQTRKS